MQAIKQDIKPFLDENFLLENQAAEILYHEYAKDQPIIDYHNHLPPDEIAADKKFPNLTAIWLNGDHYKWRAMRTLGIPERYITGPASDQEKFQKWAETVPFTIRNPLFHWTHLELQRYFGITKLLNPQTADGIYEQCSGLLNTPAYSTRNLLRKMNVAAVCSTDDPIDNLEHHRQAKADGFEITMLPAFRPDKAILVEKEEFAGYLQKLGAAAGAEIKDFDSLLQALKDRIDFFDDNGCRLSDHGLEQMYAAPFTPKQASTALKKRLSGQELSPQEADAYKSAILYELGCLYAEKGWVQQFHLGALRNNSSRMKRQLGPDTGFDSIGDFGQATALARFLNRLDTEDKLAKTILYNLNPRDNEVMATMIGNFNDGSVRGKIQFGSAWWFLDQKDGMEKQMNALSNMGLLSCFIGMLTDSRSFLSFPRHEYFRRLLCNLIGRDVHNGELPNDVEWLGGIVQDICYRNAKAYFGF
ncbi:MAG: glucuronate isomerase [Lewinellaceae bacterium]|nr:glucuronate isomerase [Phaeodactylibacter sp.]MCB9040981.1 glucuronate isomerase [Lewinellaceae bacterium]